MLNNLLLSIFFGLKEILYILLALALVVLVLVIIFKFKNGGLLLYSIFALVLLVSGIFCGYADYQYFTAKGGLVGAVDEILNKNQVVQTNYEFDFKDLALVSIEDGVYSAQITFNKEEDEPNISAIDKVIFVNKQPTNLVNRSKNYIIAEYGYTFYDEDINEICSDYLTIRFSFNEKYTECRITTNGGSEVAKQWTNYLQKNNFKVTLEEEIFVYDDSIVIDKAKSNLIKYYVNGNLINTQLFTINEESALLNYEVEEGYIFYGWFTTYPEGDLKQLESISTITLEEAVEVKLYGRYFKKDALNELGYSDASITFNIEIDTEVQKATYGILRLEYFDNELGYTRSYNITLKAGSQIITNLKYADYTLSIMGVSGLEDMEPVMITTSYGSSITKNIKLIYRTTGSDIVIV